MVIKKIGYSKRFLKEYKKLPDKIIKIARKKEIIFRDNPLHPSLRLHELHGKLERIWAITINNNYRILFIREEDGAIIFYSIGKHDIYKNI